MKYTKHYSEASDSYVIKTPSGVVVGEIFRSRGEHIDDLKARANKALKELNK